MWPDTETKHAASRSIGATAQLAKSHWNFTNAEIYSVEQFHYYMLHFGSLLFFFIALQYNVVHSGVSFNIKVQLHFQLTLCINTCFRVLYFKGTERK